MRILRLIVGLFYKPRFIILVNIFLAGFFAWMFSEIVEKIWIEKETFPFDQATRALMINGQNPIAREFFSVLTMLGNANWLIALVLIALGLLLRHKKYLESLLLIGGFVLTSVSVMLIKFLSNRARPTSDLSLLENSLSFPSGHMAHSLFVYGFISYLLSQFIKGKSASIWVMLSGIVLAGTIGLSRLYLNVHWLSDVLGGFALAAAYLCLCIGIMEAAHDYESLPNR
jgi:membrane-associated phospholipid phosphatase